METTKEGQERFTQFSGKAVEAMALWTDANQKALQEMVTVAASTATAGVRFSAELQKTLLQGVEETSKAFNKIQQSYTGLANAVKDLYMPIER